MNSRFWNWFRAMLTTPRRRNHNRGTPMTQAQNTGKRVPFTIGKGVSAKKAGAFIDQLYAEHFGSTKD